jgi:hypothetical protein
VSSGDRSPMADWLITSDAKRYGAGLARREHARIHPSAVLPGWPA